MDNEIDSQEIYIEISGVDEDLNEQMLLLYIENEFDGYEKILIVDFDSSERRSKIVVKDESVAEKILRKETLEWKGKKMVAKKTVHSGRQHAEQELNSKQLRTVQLIGNLKATDEYQLMLYIESERFDGGTVAEFTFYETGPLVTFEDAKVAKIFSSKNHKYLNFEFKAVLMEGWPLTNSSCGIEIRCSSFMNSSNFGRSMLSMLLENKRNGGEDDSIEEIFMDEEDSYRAVVTLKNHTVAKSIMETTKGLICFDSKEMYLKLLVPATPPMFVENPDKKKLLFLYLNTYHLDIKAFKAFVANCSKVSVHRLFFCPRNDRVLVQFKDDPDYQNILDVLCCKPFQGVMISVQRVSKTKKIQVSDCNESDEYLRYHFENKKYGGGRVTDISKIDEGNFIIIFEDSCDVDNVLSKSHRFVVSPYIEELGIIPKGFDSLKPPSNIPDNVRIPISKEVYGFLYANDHYKNDIESALSSLNCSISWPVSNENLNAELSWKNNQQFLQPLTSWPSIVTNCLNQKLAQYDFCEIEIKKSLFSFVSSEARKIKPGKDKLLKRIEEKNNKIFAVGLKKEIEDLKKAINESQKKADNVNVVSVCLKPHESSLIMKRHKHFEKEFEVNISIENNNLMLLEGQKDNVIKCQIRLEELKKLITQDDIEWIENDPEFLRFFDKKEIIDRIESEFSSQGIIALIRVSKESLVIYSFEDLMKAKDCFKSLITVTDIHLENNIREVLRSEEWKTFSGNLLRHFNNAFVWTIKTKSFSILTFSRDTKEIIREIMKYLDENSIKIELLPVSLPVKEFIAKQNTDIISIKTKARSVEVEIKDVSGPNSGFQLMGKKEDLVSIKKELEILCSKVIQRSFNMDGKVKNIFTSHFSNTLSGICGNKKVHIVPKGSWSSTSEKLKPVHEIRENSKLKIHVFPGSIAEQKTDVIFNCCPPNLELHHSAISKALLNSAGPKLQEELKKICKDLLSLSPGEIVETSGHNLQCLQVYHGYCTSWHKGQDESEKTVRALIKKSLEKASLDNRNSISFPVFGTGKLGIPYNKAAKFMLDEAFTFSYKSSSLKEINFVVYANDEATLKAFQDEMNSADNSSVKDDQANLSSGSHEKILLKEKGIQFLAINGDLIVEKCDAIVNSTNHSLKHEAGVLSRLIMEKAGEDVTKECEEIGTLKNGWAITSSGKMSNCKYIFHVTGRSVDDWNKVISGIFKKANDMGLTSIALPLVGTGRQKISLDEVALVFFECFKDMLNLKNLSLKILKVMIPDELIFSNFAKAIRAFNNDERNDITFPPGRGSSNKKCEIEIYGMSNACIEEAYKEIQRELEKVVTEKEIPCPLKDITMDCFKSLCHKHNVKVELKNEIIKVSGISDISSAVEAIHKIINEETMRKAEQENLKNIGKYVQWSYSDPDGKIQDFGQYRNGQLEKAYKNKEGSIDWKESNKKHCVDLKKMNYTIACDRTKDSKAFTIQRTLKGSISLPITWDPMADVEPVKLVPLKANSNEYNQVKSLLYVGAIKPTIVKIERIQNPSLYTQYACKKLDFEKKKKNSEVKVWHGTQPHNVSNINANNFNRSFGNQGSYGVGVYFAVNPDYSISSYCPPSPTGEKFIYLARVLVGNVGKGVSGLKEPPICNPSTGERYDSVSDTSPPNMYVIFYDCQMYPEYLITFK